MLHKFKEINWSPPDEVIRKFGRKFLMQTPIAGLVWFLIIRLIWGHWHVWVPIGFLIAAVLIGGMSILAPKAGVYPYRLWWGLICIIETLIVNGSLGLAFYLVITPAGLIMRLLGKDPMSSKFEKEKTSYWKDAEKITDPKRYYRQF